MPKSSAPDMWTCRRQIELDGGRLTYLLCGDARRQQQPDDRDDRFLQPTIISLQQVDRHGFVFWPRLRQRIDGGGIGLSNSDVAEMTTEPV
ncbi:hypothetical protein [Burkholderia sp. Bp9143]|uniref:hypothetical protein n=1 Tax=Burkholderia sp. Bp9143 TaxID=2184574 RepID=UPI00162831E6|nr:hypothetical protein [Burkholderia sp. Bp9143]